MNRNIRQRASIALDELYKLNIKSTWQTFKNEGAAFWMISLYILMEYIRPQGIYKWIDFFPWTRTFLLLAAALHFFFGKTKVVKDAYNFILPIFFLEILASNFLAYNSDVAFRSFPDTYSWFIVYFIVANVVSNERRLWIFTLLFFLGCSKLSVFGAKSWIERGFSFADWGISGPPGYFQNSGELSLLMCMFCAMSYSFWMTATQTTTKLKSWILLVLPISAAMTVLASSTRGSQLALFIQILYLGVALKKFSFKGVVITIFALFLTYSVLPAEQLERFSTAGTDETSTTRLIYWEKGHDMMNEFPALGVGLGNFSYYFRDHFAQTIKRYRMEVAHNSFIQVGSELGYTGLIIFIWIILRSFAVNRNTRKTLGSKRQTHHWLYPFTTSLDCAMIGYIIGGSFMSVAFYPYVWIHIAFVVAIKKISSELPALATPAGENTKLRSLNRKTAT